MDELMIDYKYTWDYLIERRSIIKELSNKQGVNQDFLKVQIDFLRAVTNNDKTLAIVSINYAINRLKDFK